MNNILSVLSVYSVALFTSRAFFAFAVWVSCIRVDPGCRVLTAGLAVQSSGNQSRFCPVSTERIGQA